MKIWKAIKLQVRLLLRTLRDLRDGVGGKLARTSGSGKPDFRQALALSQPIRSTATLENKLTNIRLACARIEPVVVRPGEIFSFWKIVGRPAERNGFRRSRNIVKGQLSEAVGGGLCQVSGILYHLALLAGLTVTERHSHSLDIYREEERHTPLGADATVVFGYKDLRLKNDFPFPVAFSFEITDNQLTCKLLSDVSIPENNIEFRRESFSGQEKVSAVKVLDAGEILLEESWYRKMEDAGRPVANAGRVL